MCLLACFLHAQASQLLTRAGSTPTAALTQDWDGQAAIRLQELVMGAGLSMKRVLQLNCPILYALMLLDLETGESATVVGLAALRGAGGNTSAWGAADAASETGAFVLL